MRSRGIMKSRLGFGDHALIFKVTAELIWSNLNVCGGRTAVFSENKTNFYFFVCRGVRRSSGTLL